MTELIPKNGGYRRLKSFQIGQLIYDLTVRFCELYIERKSRTRDQMVQAARSGVQGAAPGLEKQHLQMGMLDRVVAPLFMPIVKVFDNLHRYR